MACWWFDLRADRHLDFVADRVLRLFLRVEEGVSLSECGEQMTAEYLKAKRCNMCGAPLQQKEY